MASFIVVSCRFSLEKCESNDRLGLMHTSDHYRSVWYDFADATRSFTGEETEEEYDDKNSRNA